MAESLDLEYFKKRLLEERKRIYKNISELTDEVNMIGSEDEIDDMADMASLTVDNERDQAVLNILLDQLKDINDALRKIKEGTYGICEKTGKPIPVERLEINPAARTAK